MKHITISLLALLLLVACAPTGNVVQEGPISIGWIGPLTGDAASIGQSSRVATELAVDEINAAGGINGRPLEVIYEDGGCSGGSQPTSAANKLVNIDGVQFIVGGHCSPETLALAPISDPAGIVTISPCSSAPAVSDAGDYVFRAYASDIYQGAYAAEHVYGQGHRTVAILACVNDWCNGIMPVFTKRFEELGGKVVSTQRFDPTSRDLRTQLTKISATEPDAIYFVGFAEAAIAGIKQMKELGIGVPVLGGDAWDDPTIPAQAGAAADGMSYVVVATPGNSDFQRKMLERTDAITTCAPQAYDIVHIYADLANAGADTPGKLKDALYAMQPYDGVSGEIVFDENGDLREASYVVKGYRDGKIVG